MKLPDNLSHPRTDDPNNFITIIIIIIATTIAVSVTVIGVCLYCYKGETDEEKQNRRREVNDDCLECCGDICCDICIRICCAFGE